MALHDRDYAKDPYALERTRARGPRPKPRQAQPAAAYALSGSEPARQLIPPPIPLMEHTKDARLLGISPEQLAQRESKTVIGSRRKGLLGGLAWSVLACLGMALLLGILRAIL
jgi:hypothetical protein